MADNNYDIKGDWYAFEDIEDMEDELCLGDMLEFSRRAGYKHWGIYVGRYQRMRHAVIHFGMFEGGAKFATKKITCTASSASQKPEVRADTIEKILGGSGKVRINNSRDAYREPLSSHDISEKAKRLHRDKSQTDYNLVSNNCEHFVNLCRYDKPKSQQVWSVARYLPLGMFVGAAVGVSVTFGPVAVGAAVVGSLSWFAAATVAVAEPTGWRPGVDVNRFGGWFTRK